MTALGGIRKLLSLVHKRYLKTSSRIHSPPPEITKDSNFALRFLTNSCGLPLKSAISVFQRFPVQEKNRKKIQSVIGYLKDEGFTPTHIATLIHKVPKLMHCKVEATLKPKLEFLKHNGFVGELLTEFLMKNPSVVNVSLVSRTKPYLELLRYYLKSNDKILLSTGRCSWLFNLTTVKRNIDFLVQEGVPSSSIGKIIVLQPRGLVQKHSRTMYAVNVVRSLGLQLSSPIFVNAFRVVISMSESTLQKKVEFLQSFGWTEEEIFTAFKRHPHVLACSEEKIRKSVDFYQNTVKFDLQTIITHPVIFGLSIDSRVSRRYVILKILESKKLIKQNIHKTTVSWLCISEKAFLDKYVTKYESCVPGLFDVYSTNKHGEKLGR